jgi:hypothetical protein
MAQAKWRMKDQWVKNCASIVKATGKIKFEYHNTHSSLAYVEHLPTGVAR